MHTIGFIGLGTMGRFMATNLVRAGFTVHGHDIVPGAAEALRPAGVIPAASVAAASAAADIVVTMLPDTPDVEAVVLGAGGLLENPPPGGLVVDMSTIAPGAVRAMHARLATRGVALLDAPVSGGPQGAEAASLSIMVGGDLAAVDRARPVLAALGTTIRHVGATGAGQTVKLCNQLVCGINLQAVCEAIALARASGVDLGQMREALLGGSASSWMLDRLGPAMIAGDTKAGFRIDLMLKDLRLVQEMARDLVVPLPGTALVTTQYLDAKAHDEGTHGNQALFRVYDRMTNQARD